MTQEIFVANSTQETFTSSTTWTCPDGVSHIDVECWGGGAGGGAYQSGSAGGGGGGGAYSRKYRLAVTPGNGYAINIGSGGGGGVNGTDTGNGVAGGDTSFVDSSTAMAKGGSAGASAAASGSGGSRVSGVGDVKYGGGNGAASGGSSFGAGGGSSAGTAAAGNPGVAPGAGPGGGGIVPTGGGSGGAGGNTGQTGFAGSTPGGGGGGGATSNNSGGAGADGKIVISYAGPWTCPTGVTSVDVEAWGGGGAGGLGNGSFAGGGGGGGAYSKKTLTVTAGTKYAIYVGRGGEVFSSGNPNANLSLDGLDTLFKSASDCLAKGGTKGAATGTAGTGGASGSGVGDTKFSGGNGAAGSAVDPKTSDSRSGGGGGSAGTAANGNAASTFNGGAAVTGGGAGGRGYNFGESHTLVTSGSAPGAGGGGDGITVSRGLGADGKVVLTYQATYPTTCPEVFTGPPLRGAPWKSTYTEHAASKKVAIPSESDAVTITETLSGAVAQRTYAPEIVIGPPLRGAPWHSAFVSPWIPPPSELTQLMLDSVVLTDSMVAEPAKRTYPPEIVTGPPMGGPRKTRYTELVQHQRLRSGIAQDSLTITDSNSFSVARRTYAPEIVSGPPLRGAPWKTRYQEVNTIQLIVRTVSVSDNLYLSDQTVEVGPIYVSVVDEVPLLDSLSYSLIHFDLTDQIHLSDAAVPNRDVVISVSDTVDVTDSVHRTFEATLSDVVSIGDSLERSRAFSDLVTVTDSISIALSLGAADAVDVTDAVAISLVNATLFADAITLLDGIGYLLQQSGSTQAPIIGTCRQDKSFSPNGAAPYTAPSIVERRNVILTWPFSSPQLSLELRRPEFNNLEKKVYKRIVRQSRGGDLVAFRDPQWPKIARLNYTVHMVHQSDPQSILDFFEASLGQEVGLLDFESRQWVGFITTPDAFVDLQVGRGIRAIQFEFEGKLNSGAIA